jgi:hypothetical protein
MTTSLTAYWCALDPSNRCLTKAHKLQREYYEKEGKRHLSLAMLGEGLLNEEETARKRMNLHLEAQKGGKNQVQGSVFIRPNYEIRRKSSYQGDKHLKSLRLEHPK